MPEPANLEKQKKQQPPQQDNGQQPSYRKSVTFLSNHNSSSGATETQWRSSSPTCLRSAAVITPVEVQDFHHRQSHPYQPPYTGYPPFHVQILGRGVESAPTPPPTNQPHFHVLPRPPTSVPFSTLVAPFTLAHEHYSQQQADKKDKAIMKQIEHLSWVWMAMVERATIPDNAQHVARFCTVTLQNIVQVRSRVINEGMVAQWLLEQQTSQRNQFTHLPPWHIFPGLVLTLDNWFHMIHRRCKIRKAMGILAHRLTPSEQIPSNDSGNDTTMNSFSRNCEDQTLQWLDSLYQQRQHHRRQYYHGHLIPNPTMIDRVPIPRPLAEALDPSLPAPSVSTFAAEWAQNGAVVRAPDALASIMPVNNAANSVAHTSHQGRIVVHPLAESGTIADLSENPKPSSPSGSYALPTQAVRSENNPTTAPLPALVPTSNSISQFESSHLPNGTILWHIRPPSVVATSADHALTSRQHARRESATNVKSLVQSANGWVLAGTSPSPTNMEGPVAAATMQASLPAPQTNGSATRSSSPPNQDYACLIDAVYFAYLKQTRQKDQNDGDSAERVGVIPPEMDSPGGSTESSSILTGGSTESLDAPTTSTTVDSSGSSSSTATVAPRRRSKSLQERASVRQYQEELTGSNDAAASRW
jgi:hypothetical protein